MHRALLASETISDLDADEPLGGVDQRGHLGMIDGDGAVRGRVGDILEHRPFGREHLSVAVHGGAIKSRRPKVGLGTTRAEGIELAVGEGGLR